MALSYEVNHGFAYEGEWYNPQNADQVKNLPRSVRDDLIAAGHIVEHGGKIAVEEQPGTKGA